MGLQGLLAAALALAAPARSASAHPYGLEGDAVLLVQTVTALVAAPPAPAQAAFQVNQPLEVNVFGSTWVNCTIVSKGTRLDTYNIHVPSFPEGHRDLTNVKTSALRDPEALRQQALWRAEVDAKRKADEEARKKAEEEEKRLAEEDAKRLEELEAHQFTMGENVEVKVTAKDGNVSWVAATITGRGTEPNKYNIKVGNTPVNNINYKALRKDEAHHFEVGEIAQVKTATGDGWVTCTIQGIGDFPMTFNIHVPAAPAGRQDLRNIHVRSLRKEPRVEWTPKYEIGELMEVRLPPRPGAVVAWERCNITGKAVRVETYHIQVLSNASGYPMYNVSASLLRETQEGLAILMRKKLKLQEQEEARLKKEEEQRRKDEEEAIKKRYALHKMEEAEEESRAMEELVKKNPLMNLAMQAKKQAELSAMEVRNKQRQHEEVERRREAEAQRVAEQMRQRERLSEEQRQQYGWQRAEGIAGEAWIMETKPKASGAADAYLAHESRKDADLELRQQQALAQAAREEEDGMKLQEQIQRRQKAQQAAALEKKRQKAKAAQAREQYAARMILKQSQESVGVKPLISALRTALREANRTGIGAADLIEPRTMLLKAVQNKTTVQLREAIASRYSPLLQKAIMDGQAASLEIKRLKRLIAKGEAELRDGEMKAAGNEDMDLKSDPEARANAAATLYFSKRQVYKSSNTDSMASQFVSLGNLTSKDFTASELNGTEFQEAQRILHEEDLKWSALFHMKDAERNYDMKQLKLAIGEAQESSVFDFFVAEGKALLALNEALHVEDVNTLRDAIRDAENVTAWAAKLNYTSNQTLQDLVPVRQALALEEKRVAARLTLQEAVAGKDLEQLGAALRQAEAAKLRRADTQEARELKSSIIAEQQAKEQEARRVEEAARRKERAEAQLKLKQERQVKAAEQAKVKAEEKARRQAEAKERAAEIAKQKEERRQVLRQEAEVRAREKAKQKAEREERRKAEQQRKAEEQAKLMAEIAEEESRMEKQEAEARLQVEEAKTKAREAEEKAKEEEAKEEEDKQRAEAEKKAKEEEEAKQRAEAEQKAKQEEQAKQEEEAKQRAEAEQKAKQEEDTKQRAEAEKKAKEEEEARQRAQAEKEAREQEGARQRAEDEEKVKEEARQKAEAAQKAREKEARQKAQQAEATPAPAQEAPAPAQAPAGAGPPADDEEPLSLLARTAYRHMP